MLERLDHVGGAAVSAHAFDGVDARLSRYSYLVSLLPRRIVDDLGARVRLARRRYSSYTPDPATAGRTGLLIGPDSSFDAVGAAGDEAGFAEFYRRCRIVDSRLWPTLTTAAAHPRRGRAVVWVTTPGRVAVACRRADRASYTEAVETDLVRGVMATDAADRHVRPHR